MESILTHKAQYREKELLKVIAGQMTQTEAAKILKLRRERVNVLMQLYKKGGVAALVSKRVGKPSNNAFKSEFKAEVKAIAEDERYLHFGPTFLVECLYKYHQKKISKETLRQWMIEWELWKFNQRKTKRIHERRLRRPRAGELIQTDGSHHAWFEARAPKCCLIVMIDDATNRIVGHFAPSEDTDAYMQCMNKYIAAYGIPRAIYHDRHSVFVVAETEDKMQRTPHTQFGRMLHTLSIESISAHTPQAKGRVERCNHTLQDRLVKALRLEGISDIEQANKYLEKTFLEEYNNRFSVEPVNSDDAHITDHGWSEQSLHELATIRAYRVMDNSLSLSYNNQWLQIKSRGGGHHLKGKRIEIRHYPDGAMRLWYKEKQLDYKIIRTRPVAKVATDKTLNGVVDTAVQKPYKPGKDHPWRRDDICGHNARSEQQADASEPGLSTPIAAPPPPL